MLTDSNFIKYRTTEFAKKAAKLHYQNQCILTGSDENIVGAHLFTASVFPDVKCYRESILPIHWDFHTGKKDTLDWVDNKGTQREATERIIWIYPKIADMFKDQVNYQLRRLRLLLWLKGNHRGINAFNEASDWLGVDFT